MRSVTNRAKRSSRARPTGAQRGSERQSLDKALTGIAGFDEITHGGLPRGRPTLVCGRAGCGKTLFATQFLVRGALDSAEPGLFVSFEEFERDIIKNVTSLGFDLPDLIDRKLLAIDHVRVLREEIAETGEYDLDGLFIRLGYAIDSIGAKRVVLDTIEALFSGLDNPGILRAELRRLFGWLKQRGVTAVITAEQGDSENLTRHGLEEFVSDCVVLLDHRIVDQVSTRRIRVVKYRGSTHGTNEYPFLIDEDGISVVPITSAGLQHTALTEQVSTGIPRLDEMIDGGGYYRGSTILISGTAGSGKSSMASHFIDAACRRGEKSIYFSMEESPDQIKRNMRSIGMDLQRWERSGLLRFVSTRPTMYGMEMHLALIHRELRQLMPSVVVVDPISALLNIGNGSETRAMVLRLVDYLKMQGITCLFTSLTTGGHAEEQTEVAISSLVDSWLLATTVELAGERNRALYILKSRGMNHSNQIREFFITSRGVDLTEVYVGPEGVLTGTARLAQEAREAAAARLRSSEIERLRRDIERKRAATEAQIEALQAQIRGDEEELKLLEVRQDAETAVEAVARLKMGQMRWAAGGRTKASRGSPTNGTGKRRK